MSENGDFAKCPRMVIILLLLCCNATAFVICAIKNYLLTYLLIIGLHVAIADNGSHFVTRDPYVTHQLTRNPHGP